MPTPTPTTQDFADRRFDTAIQAALGKPWVVLGRGPDTFDCWGLVLWVYRAAGVVLPDFAYDIRNDRATLFQILGSEEIPAGQYPEALRVDTGAIRAWVDALDIRDVSPMVHNLQRSRIFEDGSKFIGSWTLPDPDATPSNCVKFPGK